MPLENLIPITDCAKWKESLDGIKHSFANSWEGCYAMYLTHGCDTYLYTFVKGKIRIVCPICERSYKGFTDVFTPHGFSGITGNAPCRDFQKYWKKFARDNGYICGYIKIHPIFDEKSYYDPEDAYRYNSVFILDLTLPYEQLFANLSRNRKRQLRYYDETIEKVSLERPLLTEFFLKNFHDFMTERNANANYLFSKETLSFILRLQNTLLVGIKENGQIIAASLSVFTPYMGDCLFNISISGGQSYSVFLTWYAVKYIKSIGIPLLNLGGGIQDDDNLAIFKKRFGPGIYPLKSLKQVYKAQIYKHLCNEVNLDPEDKIGFFPLYHRS